MTFLVQALLVMVGLLNFAPVIGVASGPRLSAMYGVQIESAGQEILLRHRAMLFGIVGALLIGSAFVAEMRAAAMGAGFASMASFVVIAALVGQYGARIRKVVLADVAGITLLTVAALLSLLS